MGSALCSRLCGSLVEISGSENEKLTVARRDVVHDRAFVTVRPGVPRKLDGISCVGIGIQAACSGALVAVHVAGTDGRRLDKAEILVQGVPASGLWTAVRWEVVPDRVGSIGDCSLDSDTLDKAVGRCRLKEQSGSAEEEDSRMHRNGQSD